MNTEKLAEKMNMAFGGLTAVCALASHPDCTDKLLQDAWELWDQTWAQQFRHDCAMNMEQVRATMKRLVQHLLHKGQGHDPEQVAKFVARMNGLVPGLFK
jgi:hypothetical protein